MATGFFFKTSEDVGAPSLTNVAGSLIAVLDWVLDTAGGTHWEKVYSGTNKAVYRATTGIRPYLRVVDDESTDGAADGRAGVRMYASMSDIDTGLGVVPTVPSDFTDLYWHYEARGGATPKGYFAVGDSRGFAIYIRQNDGDTTWDDIGTCYFFGEPVPLDPSDAWSACLIADIQSITSTSVTSRFLPYGSYIYSFSGSGGSYPAFWLKTSNGTTDGPGMRIWRGGPVNGNIAEGPVTHAFPYYLKGLADDSSSDGDGGYARGRLPYVYNPMSRFLPTGWNIGDTLDLSGSLFRIINAGTTANDPNSFFLMRESNDEPGRV